MFGSFRYNLAYADIFWEENTILSLKGTVKIVQVNRAMETNIRGRVVWGSGLVICLVAHGKGNDNTT
jgi:hypothetical protein